MRKINPRAMAALSLVILVLAGACKGSDPPRPPSLVLLVSLDTLRKNAVGVYGGEAAASTPALDRLASDAVRIDGARTAIPFTLSAHMSLFTGLSPLVHGVRHASHRLNETIPTLPERLRAEGYATHGIAVNYWMKGDFGFARGFDSYDLQGESLETGRSIALDALEIVDAHRASEEPLFLFLQFFDAHSASSEITDNTLPYYSPQELRRDVAPDRNDPTYCDPESGCATGYLVGANAGRTAVSDATRATLAELYRRSVEDLDHSLSILFDGLRERGLYAGALIVVTSDHGEEFGEHGMFLHHQTYDETLAVPLFIKFPDGRGAGRRVETLAGLVDILPTLLAELGLAAPPAIQGRSLLPAIDEGVAIRDSLVGRDKGRDSRLALIEADAKLIFDFETQHAELYDLRSDPAERQNLAPESPDRVEAMRARLIARIRDHRQLVDRLRLAATPREEAELDESERQALRALGYVDEAANEKPVAPFPETPGTPGAPDFPSR